MHKAAGEHHSHPNNQKSKIVYKIITFLEAIREMRLQGIKQSTNGTKLLRGEKDTGQSLGGGVSHHKSR